jgi:hypothetical protein
MRQGAVEAAVICSVCASPNPDAAGFCVQCGAKLDGAVSGFALPSPPPGSTVPPPSAPALPGSPPVVITIPTYLAPAIVVTILCCVPLGIPAIIFAAQVNGRVTSGDVAGAMEASRKAKMWCWIAFGVGIVVMGTYFVLAMAGAFVDAFK